MVIQPRRPPSLRSPVPELRRGDSAGRPDRRRFLLLAGGLGGGSLALAAWLLREAERHPWTAPPAAGASNDLQPVTRTSRALGSDVTITALHREAARAGRAVDAAFGELERIESLLSIYRPNSELSRLNRDGAVDADASFLEVLRAAAEMSRRSRGAFDVTVQPLWQLYSDAAKDGSIPREAEIAQARGCVDWRRVRIKGRCVQLDGDGTAITLNGIAQGYAADRAMWALQEHDVQHALINTGEIGALGARADREAWQVGIQHPRHDDAYLALARLSGRCLATSGDYATRFADGYRFHHLFDPRTGRSPLELAAVSVVATTAMEADALSTAVFVMGPQAGLELIRTTPGADALFVLKDGTARATPGFPSATSDLRS
jgi:FAD:protein FMN transferase